MAMYSYDLSVAASAISAIVPDPSLQRECICKSPRRLIGHARFLTSSCLASASEMKSWRMSGGLLLFLGRFVQPALNLPLDERANCAKFGERSVLRYNLSYLFRPQKS